MSRKKIFILKKDLEKLYLSEGKSPTKIGKLYNCTGETVLARIKECEIPLRSPAQARMKYPKHDFDGILEEKAYLIGFRLGDLSVRTVCANSEMILVDCHTTREDQVELVKNLFSKYGRVAVGRYGQIKSACIDCYLNMSFNFLLSNEDKVKDWIQTNNKYSAAFAAGYIDAEGSFGIYEGRGRFKMDSYDKNIIHWFYDWFSSIKVNCPRPYIVGRTGQIYNKEHGYKYNKDVWRIRVSIKDSLLRLIYAIEPYIQHEKRRLDMKRVKLNVYQRNGIKRNKSKFN